MTPNDARRILLFHRIGTPDAETEEVAAALDLARRDPELRRWLEEHELFEGRLRQSLRSIRAPESLRDRIIAGRAVVKTRQPARVLLALAAMVVLLAAAVGWWLRSAPPDRFADYRQRMVSGVLRSYHMELETNDTGEVRDFMARAGSPADFEIPPGLAKLELAGGGRLQWRGNPVSMVCFNRGDDEMLFLFVMRGRGLSDVPAAEPSLTQVNKLATMSWTRGENVYLLAGLPEPGFADRFP